MNRSKIAWTDVTWNPTTGCSHVSDGCKNCYAERVSLKFKQSALPWTLGNVPANFELHPERLGHPFNLKKPSLVFVDSMSDLFHEACPDWYLRKVFDVMVRTPQHRYQILTKRPARAAAWEGPWPGNIWLGASVEDERVLWRVALIADSPAKIRFISAEPLLGPLAPMDLRGIDWVIAGGESGPGFRPMEMQWVRDIRDQCVARKVAFFFKQQPAFRPADRPYIVEASGAKTEWQQYPGDLAEPVAVAGSPQTELFPIHA